jgi:transglutaminase-like putative cysteine protease
MRLSIDHRTRYNFSEPQARVIQLLRMTPMDNGSQTISDWHIDVNCDARLREGRDGYGNVTTMLYIDGPILSVEIEVRGDVVTEDHNGLLTAQKEALPSLFFKRTTPASCADEAIAAFAQSLAGGLANVHDQAKALNTAVRERFETRPGRTPKSRTAAESFGLGWGSARDAAHLLLAAARSLGIPGRFVSGHCLDGPNSATHKSAHCWTELHIDKTGWIGFDPSTGRNPGETYVRVAIGLDASDGTPLSGTRTGGGIEELDVDVRVEMSSTQNQ